MAGPTAAKMTAPDGVVVGAGVLGYISSFLPWYTVSFSVLSTPGFMDRDAWHAGFGAYLSVLLLLVASTVVLVSTLGGLGRSTATSLITLGISVLALVTLVLRWVTFPDASGGLGRLGGFFDLSSAFAVSSGAGVGLYLGLSAAIAAVVASLLLLFTFRAAGRDVAR
ncbi:MAG: hypothetical protein JO115_19670 [Pseudonocardiales bacterium]|nr:hypothetical protein [Pseudonocardiales bacterium]